SRTEPTAALALRTRPGVAGPVWRAQKWIGAAPAAFRPYRRPALIERRIAAVLAAVPRANRAPASAGPRRLAPLRARPALGVSVGEQQSHYCHAEQNKTERAHGLFPVGCCAIVADIWALRRRQLHHTRASTVPNGGRPSSRAASSSRMPPSL